MRRVWKALTDAEEMRRWYFDMKEFKPKVGFEFEFTFEHEGVKYEGEQRENQRHGEPEFDPPRLVIPFG